MAKTTHPFAVTGPYWRGDAAYFHASMVLDAGIREIPSADGIYSATNGATSSWLHAEGPTATGAIQRLADILARAAAYDQKHGIAPRRRDAAGHYA